MSTPSASVRWPINSKTFRGGGLPARHRGFFREGVRFRVPHFLATSFSRTVAQSFMRRQAEAPVLWTFEFTQRRCLHVNHLRHTSGGEDEFLFVPYSAFEVIECEWAPQPSLARPHRVRIRVAADNRDLGAWPEDLPLAPWA